MFRHRFDENVNISVALHWFLMSFSAGCVNAGGFIATGRFVTHVTGFATLFGFDIAHWQLDAALGILSVPLFFMIGALVAGLLIDRRIHVHKQPHFDYVMIISGLCLFLAALGGNSESFSEFGQNFHLKQNYILLALLCLASGLQNAAISSGSDKSVRTTHLTGITTDLGLGLARILTFHLNDKSLRKGRTANLLRIGNILAFVTGSAAGAILFNGLKYHGFFVPAIIAFYAAWHGRSEKMKVHHNA